MLELPELYTITKQMNEELIGKTVISGSLLRPNGNLFMPREEAENYALLQGGQVISIDLAAPDIYIKLDNGYGILFCQCGGKILYHTSTERLPPNRTIEFYFSDESAISYTINLWSLGIYAVSHDRWNSIAEDHYKNLFQPLAEHTYQDYLDFIEANPDQEKTPVKIFLSKHVAGVMSTFAAEILLHAGIYPSKMLKKLSRDDNVKIYNSIVKVLRTACDQGGRTSESDLYANKGRYTAMAERKHIGESCPVCGNVLEKASSGGVTAYCPTCQKK